MLVRAWASSSTSGLRRAVAAMNWLYRRIAPTRSNLSTDAAAIIASGEAFCMGYTVALGTLLRREGYDVRWITMQAEGHSRGRGNKQIDTHEVVQTVVSGTPVVLDPTTNTYFPHSIEELLQRPSLADAHANDDERCRKHGFSLYNTSYWYSRVSRYAIRPSLSGRDFKWTRVRRA